MKKKLLFVFSLLLSTTLTAQIQKPTFDLDITKIKQNLQKVELQRSYEVSKNQALTSGITINLPTPEGILLALSPIESPVMSDKLSKDFPSIKTYRLFGNNNISGVLTISPEGIHAFIFTDDGNIMISPSKIAVEKYYVFYQNDNELKELCEIGDEHLKKNTDNTKSVQDFTNGTTLRSYRMAIVTTGEFFTNNGSTQATAQAAVVSMVNSLRAVYEKEVSVTFSLVSTKIYEDAATDPLNPNSGSKALDAAAAFGALATSNAANFALTVYDIGHVIHHSPGGGGVAYLNGPCNNSNLSVAGTPVKAGAWSGGTTTSLTTFIHEVGHQFSAGHTFNSVNSGCNGNIMTGSAYEPGSGSTYMSYWGSCSPDNISGAISRTYFHANSLESIVNFSTNTATCGVNSATGNIAPVVATNPNARTLIIPRGTPFRLDGSGSDANGETVLFNWEQYNLGSTRGAAKDAQNSTNSPIFRSFAPSATGNVRTFPALASILKGSPPDNDEALPQVARTIMMRLTGRDGRVSGGGGAISQSLTLTIDNSGPFLITSQNINTYWVQGSPKTITWSVNGTNAAPLNCSNVDILFSSDNGVTFPTVLVANSINDGSHSITVPTTITSTGRIKIVPTNTNLIFFDINNAPISIVSALPACDAETSSLTPTTAVSALAGAAALNLNLYSYSIATSVSKTTAATDPTMQLVGYNATGCVTPYTNTMYLKTYTFRVATAGSYTFTITGSVGAKNINLYNGAASTGCLNWMAGSLNMASGVVYNNNLTATLAANTTYQLTLSSTINTSSTGTINVSFSGDGSILQPVPNENSFYSYNYVIVNTTTNVVTAIQSNSDLTNSAIFSSGSYAVYGISFLTENVNFSSYINQPFASLQSAITGNTICVKLSSNNVAVTILNDCQSALNLSGVANTGTQAANQSVTSTQMINSGVNVTYRAANSITLSPQTGGGFSAVNGSVFKAEIGGCN